MADIKYQRLLGQGSFGNIFLAKRSDQSYIAVKMCDLNHKKYIENEIKYHELIGIHKNIVQFICCFESDKHIMFGIEYVNGCDLFEYLIDYTKKNRCKGISEDISKVIFIQLLDGIEFIHSNNICHRDLKLENILIDKDLNIKICDFGHSTSTDKLLDDLIGTPEYCAPELITGSYDGCLADLWSLGIILYILLAGKYPFNRPRLNTPYLTYDVPYLDYIDHKVFSLIREIVKEHPENRLRISDIRKHYWLC